MTSEQHPDRELPPLVDVMIAVAVAVLVIALLAAGGAPRSVPAGLTGASTAVSWALPLLRLIADAAAIACSGCLLAAVWLLQATDGQRLGGRAVRACRDAAVAAGIWSVATAGGLVSTAAVVLGIPLTQLPERATDAAGVPQIRALAATVLVTAVLAIVLSGCRSVVTARIAAFLTAVAVIAPLLTGHAAAEQSTVLATVATASLAVHVLAASAWIGGLGALVRYARVHDPITAVTHYSVHDPIAAVTRYSRLALVAAASTGFSGLVTAEIHLAHRGGWDLVTGWFAGGYGVLALAKVFAFVVLVAIGGWHRHTTLPLLGAGDNRPFWRLAIVELILMAATVGIAVALSRTP
ncbi:MAG TPA: CopD family protein [Kribbella sp.]|nr:CopD family protein [Kribbella sp.]